MAVTVWRTRMLFFISSWILLRIEPVTTIKGVLLDRTGGKTLRTMDIQAVEGKKAELPCDISSGHQDKVHMVFWFKDDAGIPLYSFDVRGVGTSEGRHWSAPGVFGTRAHFRASPPPAALLLQDVKRHDEGVYRCRVDYRNTQTMSFRYNFTVIVPPEKPIIVDARGPINGSEIGPMLEGDNLVLNCRVLGGRPEPTVRWLVNGVLVDEEYEHNTGDVIENRLSWPAIGRQDLGSIFTCQAVNSILVEPRESSFLLSIYLKPLTIDINTINGPLVADKRYTVTCRSSGARPPAVITWYKGKRQLKRSKEETRENTTISELSFVPTTEDDGKPLTCRAENPNVTGLYLETSWNMNVVYPPVVNLKLGSTLTAEDIKEGDDVYFECHVHSNPPWRKLHWMHNGVLLNHNISARVVRSNQSLVLQRVARHSAGKYSCSATNAEGETVSNEFHLRVKFAPLCKKFGAVAVGAGREERVLVYCDVDADPPARSFKWKFNNSGETLDVGADKYSSNGSSSILRYTPRNDLDYGTLSCTAFNDIGHQLIPCIFQLVAAGKPQPVGNCTLSNLTHGIAEIICEAGFDGGLPQQFLLEVYSDTDGEPRYNMTSSEAIFSVPLEPDVTFRMEVYAFNAKGRSLPLTLTGIRSGDAEKRTAPRISWHVSPWMGALAGGILSLIALCTLVVVRSRRRRSNQQRVPPPSEEKLCPQAGALINSSQTQPMIRSRTPIAVPVKDIIQADDRDPDVIPVNYEPPPLYSRTWGNNSKDVISREMTTRGGILSRSCSGESTPRPVATVAAYYTPDTALNVQAFKEKILDTRLPESCV